MSILETFSSARLGLFCGTATAALASGISINDEISISLGIVGSVTTTVFLCGMWLSNKITKLEGQIEMNVAQRTKEFAEARSILTKLETDIEALSCKLPRCVPPEKTE